MLSLNSLEGILIPSSENAITYQTMGKAYQDLNQLQKAATCFSTYLSFHPDDNDIIDKQKGIINSLISTGQYQNRGNRYSLSLNLNNQQTIVQSDQRNNNIQATEQSSSTNMDESTTPRKLI